MLGRDALYDRRIAPRAAPRAARGAPRGAAVPGSGDGVAVASTGVSPVAAAASLVGGAPFCSEACGWPGLASVLRRASADADLDRGARLGNDLRHAPDGRRR